jgi:hypothetical protein
MEVGAGGLLAVPAKNGLITSDPALVNLAIWLRKVTRATEDWA